MVLVSLLGSLLGNANLGLAASYCWRFIRHDNKEQLQLQRSPAPVPQKLSTAKALNLQFQDLSMVILQNLGHPASPFEVVGVLI